MISKLRRPSTRTLPNTVISDTCGWRVSGTEAREVSGTEARGVSGGRITLTRLGDLWNVTDVVTHLNRLSRCKPTQWRVTDNNIVEFLNPDIKAAADAFHDAYGQKDKDGTFRPSNEKRYYISSHETFPIGTILTATAIYIKKESLHESHTLFPM